MAIIVPATSYNHLNMIHVNLTTSAGGNHFANDFYLDIGRVRDLSEGERKVHARRLVDQLVGALCDQWRKALDGQ